MNWKVLRPDRLKIALFSIFVLLGLLEIHEYECVLPQGGMHRMKQLRSLFEEITNNSVFLLLPYPLRILFYSIEVLSGVVLVFVPSLLSLIPLALLGCPAIMFASWISRVVILAIGIPYWYLLAYLVTTIYRKLRIMKAE